MSGRRRGGKYDPEIEERGGVCRQPLDALRGKTFTRAEGAALIQKEMKYSIPAVAYTAWDNLKKLGIFQFVGSEQRSHRYKVRE